MYNWNIRCRIRLVNGFESKPNFTYLYIFRVLKHVLWVDVTKVPSGRKNTGSGDNPTNMYSGGWLPRNGKYVSMFHLFGSIWGSISRTILIQRQRKLDRLHIGFWHQKCWLQPPPCFEARDQSSLKKKLASLGLQFSPLMVGSPSQLPPIEMPLKLQMWDLWP